MLHTEVVFNFVTIKVNQLIEKKNLRYVKKFNVLMDINFDNILIYMDLNLIYII